MTVKLLSFEKINQWYVDRAFVCRDFDKFTPCIAGDLQTLLKSTLANSNYTLFPAVKNLPELRVETCLVDSNLSVYMYWKTINHTV